VAVIDKADPVYAGQALYTRRFLAVYDAVIYGFNSPVLWRCPKVRLIELYDAHVSGRHLDIGVGTGRLLDECRFPVADPEITLMDLNPNSLDAAARRLARYAPRTHRASVLDAWGLLQRSFDSVAMCHLLHCLPGAIPQKAVAFEHASAALAPGGVLFGATLLGEGVEHTWLSRRALAASNRRRVMCNLNDTLEDLDAALDHAFDSHQIEVVGSARCSTHTPRRDRAGGGQSKRASRSPR
jgi:SAM-dependent methyltransferase